MAGIYGRMTCHRSGSPLTIFCVTLLITLSLGGRAGAGESERIEAILQPEEVVGGASQAVWSARWWQWASSFQYSESPIADRTGDRCDAGQSGSVWFLAGALGSVPVRRRCTVPVGTHLFFPIVNFSVTADSAAADCDQLTRRAKDSTDQANALALIVNDREVRDLVAFRQATPECFNLGERVQQIRAPTAANGYFVMLKPLPPGRHVIKWGGVLPSIRQAVVYEITVGEPAKWVD
jgi:hypothetical protein